MVTVRYRKEHEGPHWGFTDFRGRLYHIYPHLKARCSLIHLNMLISRVRGDLSSQALLFRGRGGEDKAVWILVPSQRG